MQHEKALLAELPVIPAVAKRRAPEMPSEQPLELGMAQPRGLALIVFTARSTLTLALSFFGESLPRGINDLSLS